jgi:hypothetical protein
MLDLWAFVVRPTFAAQKATTPEVPASNNWQPSAVCRHKIDRKDNLDLDPGNAGPTFCCIFQREGSMRRREFITDTRLGQAA